VRCRERTAQEPLAGVRHRGDRRQGLQDAELARQQGVHRPRLLRNLAGGALRARRDPPHRPGLLPRQGVLGQGPADRLLPEVLSMTPQDHFLVVAPVAAGKEAGLRALLHSMNAEPGMADPRNDIVPFAQFDKLHFARLALLDDALQADLRAHGVEPERLPTCLVFIGDCDGTADDALADLARRAGPGLARIFAHCEGFSAGSDLLAWMRAHERRSAASFVNWVGRTVRQIREESALHRALAARVP